MNKLIISFSLFSVLFFSSCDEIFEDDITNESITIISPANQATLLNPTQTFWWDEIEEALFYDMQIATPNFTDSPNLILDTTLVDNQVVFSIGSLEKGQSYEWRVRGRNGSSETTFFTQSFFISNEIDLSTSQVLLTAPATNDTLNVNSTSNAFSWQAITGAEGYQIELSTQFVVPFDPNPITLIVPNTTLTDFSLLTNNTRYFWRVRATNALPSESLYSEIREVVITGN